jgi:hypothetical protein
MSFIESNDPTIHLALNKIFSYMRFLYNIINCCLYVKHIEFWVILNIRSTQFRCIKHSGFRSLTTTLPWAY